MVQTCSNLSEIVQTSKTCLNYITKIGSTLKMLLQKGFDPNCVQLRIEGWSWAEAHVHFTRRSPLGPEHNCSDSTWSRLLCKTSSSTFYAPSSYSTLQFCVFDRELWAQSIILLCGHGYNWVRIIEWNQTFWYYCYMLRVIELRLLIFVLGLFGFKAASSRSFLKVIFISFWEF